MNVMQSLIEKWENRTEDFLDITQEEYDEYYDCLVPEVREILIRENRKATFRALELRVK